MAKILVVDDERDIIELLKDYFELGGHTVLTASNGAEAVAKAGEGPDLILLDVNMPDMDGFQVCETIRKHVSCPILFLTAKVREEDKLEGFRVGGDDYILKPFSMSELGARVAAHLRREERRGSSTRVRFEDDFVIDYAGRAVYCGEKELSFANKEFEIIELLSRHSGQVFDKERIYELLWGFESEGDSSVVAEHIRRIRAKLAAAGCKPFIETIWGAGYKWSR